MARLHLLAAAAVIGCASAFTTPARSVALSRRTAPKAGPFDDPDAFVAPSPPPKGRLGSSVDQDGKSNICMYPRHAISAPRPCFRPKLGHNRPLIPSNSWSERNVIQTARDPRLKHDLNLGH